MSNIEILKNEAGLMTFEERLDGMVDAGILASKKAKVTYNTGNGRALQAVLPGKALGPAFDAQTPEEAHNATFGIAGSVTLGKRLEGGQRVTSKVNGSTLRIG